ncbi:MAG: IS630 family transposase, partial [Rubrobacter sp.]|nr:IS630 family transposase [Rubrobacter sp.]
MRLLWRTQMDGLDPGCLVFVDEMGVHTSLAPIYAYAPVGEREFYEIPRNRGRNTTLLSSLHSEGMGPSMAVEGATTSGVFETYVERLLAPTLRPGQVVVMDNLGAHRPKRVRELIEARGCELVYLPAYSPDLNPIEEAFSKVKHVLRKIAARTKEALVEAMGAALDAVSAEDARGFFAHCGYHAPAQQLGGE